MRLVGLFTALCAAALVSAEQRTVQIFIQPIDSSSPKPRPLAEVSYDPASLASSSVISYEAPEIPESADLVRIGLYDAKSSSWLAGTTVAAADNFVKGYAPNLILSVDARGEILSAACKGVAIDAGQTRDFGPKAVVLVEASGAQPSLNKPVVLSAEGKKVAEEPEKSFLQKYGLPEVLDMGQNANMGQILVDDWYSRGAGRERRRRRRREIGNSIRNGCSAETYIHLW